MSKENIVEVLNEHLTAQRNGSNVKGHFVLHKNVQTESIPAYKTYMANLWYVQDMKKFEVLKVSLTDRVLYGEEESMIKNMETKLLFEIFDMYGSDKWSKIVKGDIDGLLENE